MKFWLAWIFVFVTISAFGQQPEKYKSDCDKTDDDKDVSYLDCRGSINGYLAIGTTVDTFQAAQVLQYINPDASGDVRLRGFGGIEVAYRVFGNPFYKRPDDAARQRWDLRNLLIYARVLHGTRSTDALCTDQTNAQNPACTQKLVPPPSPTDVANQFYFMVRNATSLDGMIGLRWELARLQQTSNYPANVYLKGQLGFSSVAGTKGSVLDVHQLMLGATATRSNWQDSYLEFGWGRTDFFSQNKRKRFKFEAQAQYRIAQTPLYFFTVGKMDTDFGTGSDSYQTYIGFKLNMGQIKEWGSSAKN